MNAFYSIGEETIPTNKTLQVSLEGNNFCLVNSAQRIIFAQEVRILNHRVSVDQPQRFVPIKAYPASFFRPPPAPTPACC